METVGCGCTLKTWQVYRGWAMYLAVEVCGKAVGVALLASWTLRGYHGRRVLGLEFCPYGLTFGAAYPDTVRGWYWRGLPLSGR